MAALVERNCANPTGRPKFIKMMSHASLIKLVVPREFIQHLDESALKTATLFSPSGKFWHIQMLLNQDDDQLDVHFGRGWEVFVQAHSLKPGNFVLFRYEGNTVFSVKIFRSDGCCAWYDDCNDLDATPKHLVQDLAVTSENVDAKVSQKRMRNNGQQIFRFEWTLRSYNVDWARAQIYLPRGLVSTMKSEMISIDCNGRLWPVRLWVGLNEKTALTTGWKPLVRENKLEEGDKCIFETITQGVLGLEIKKKAYVG